MLYPRWLETSRYHAARPAIYEGTRVITFADLAKAVDDAPIARAPVIARSGDLSFFVDILRAWRDGQAVIPVERDTPEPILRCALPDECALVKYTPGASGIPRGIFFNAAQIIADGERLVAAMQMHPSTPNLGVISLAHSYGFSNVLLPMLLHGVPIHLAAVPFPRVVEEIFSQHASMVVPAVPSIWRAWHRAGILKGAPIAFALSAGAPLSLELETDVFNASGLKIHNFYGASECGGISLDFTDTPRQVASHLGSALPGVEISMGLDQRFLIHSSSVAIGYDAPREDDQLGGGAYLTRDLGYITPAGDLHLTGNSGHAINVAGRKVSPAKVEAAILATGLVSKVRITGQPSADAERCEEISANLELQPGCTLEQLKSALVLSLPLWELPRHWQQSF
jgi:long-chain acyl-CoA synthetase